MMHILAFRYFVSIFSSNNSGGNNVFFFLSFSFVAAAVQMERLPLAVNYVMVTVTMVAPASWILKLVYLCACEYLLIWVT